MTRMQYRYITEIEVVVTLDVGTHDQAEKIASDDERVRITGMLDGEQPEETELKP